MTHTFTMEVVTPKRIIAPRAVQAMNLPTDDGRVTILAHHQPLISSLTEGRMSVVSPDGEKQEWNIGTGVVEVGDNSATLFVRYADHLPQEAPQNA